MFTYTLVSIGSVLFTLSSIANAAIVANAPYNIKITKADGTAGSCLTASSNANNAAVTLQACTNSAAQQWTFPSGAPLAGSSSSQMISIFGNKCLDVTNGIDQNGTKMQIFTCTAGNTNQNWVVNSNTTFSSIQWAGHGKCLDNTGGVMTNGNPTQIWACTGGNTNQEWIPVFAGAVLPSGTPMQLSHGSSCLSAVAPTNNEPVTIQPCNANVHTNTWVFSGGSLKIEGNFCLDVTNGVDADGTLLQIFSCVNGNTNQQWKLLGNSSIQWAGHNKCVDLTNGNTTPGTQMQIFSCFNGNTNQEWTETPIFVQ